MLFLYDHLIALLVGSIIILMLFTIQRRALQENVEQAMINAAKKQTLELADALERDLANAGYATVPGQGGITAYSMRADGVTDTLAFWGSDAAGTQIEVRYVVSVVDTVMIEGETLPLFEMQRFQRNGGPWVHDGGSPSTLTHFSITLLDENNLVTGPADVRQLRVQVTNAVFPHIVPDDYLRGYRQLHWGITLTPSSLADFQGG